MTAYTLGRDRQEIPLPGPDQPLYIRYSSDHGRTWSQQRVAFSYPAGRGTMPRYEQSVGPYLLLDRQNTLHLFATRYYGMPGKGDPSAIGLTELYHNVSRDEGTGIFKASGSIDPMGLSVGARSSFPRP